MPNPNPITLPSCSPLPAYARVLSNARLVARGHNSQSNPWVPCNTIVKVESIQPYAGYTMFARFTHEEVQCHLPITDLEELALSDPSAFRHQTEENLWLEILSRLEQMSVNEAEAELASLQDMVRAAGGGVEVFIVFAQSWLSTTKV